jgi:leucyl-tRNA synthetase
MKYNHRKIEKRWQEVWGKTKLYLTRDEVKGKENFYTLVEFPYPSGNLHVGHWYAFSVPDIFARMKRMQGKNVLFPIGFDAFGLPAENAALKRGINPRKWTDENIDYMRKQLRTMGASFDWSREVVTCDPEYYKWTQWIFLQFFKAGLAYQADTPVNWCPSCKTVLANEQVIGGQCERCDSLVERRKMKQWQLKITDYAEKLLKGLKTLDWPGEIKESQRNWIGRSEGAEIEFRIKNKELRIKKALVIYGLSGDAKENWFPWLKETLEKDGWEVSVPLLPDACHPEIEEWNKVLSNEFKTNSIIVGHSLGVPAALNLVQTAGKEVNKLILVAPVNPNQDWKHLKTAYPSADWDAVKRFADIKFDWKKISNLVGQIVIYYSDNDEYIHQSSVEFYRKHLPNAIFKFIPGKGHFNRKSGTTEFPEILDDISPSIEVFTTRPDTIFGATYLVLAPEHELISKIKNQISNIKEVNKYIEQAKRKTELQRQAEEKEKTGVELKGVKAINPATKEEIPIWIADYVMMGYGTGAIMAVPAHDERDFAFAKKYNLPIRQVIAPYYVSQDDPPKKSIPTVERNAMVIIVRDPSTEKYLCLKWHASENWKTFITGGVEEGEDLNTAARREVLEETGYKKLKFIKKMDFAAHEHFYHIVKKENRYARFSCLVFDLEDSTQQQIAESEKKLHKPVWVEENKVRDFVVANVFKYFWKLWLEGEQAYVEPGVLINSGKYSGKKSLDAIPAMAKEFGKAKVNYRLRDWIISRQRYWGCPIPLVFCENCAEKIKNQKSKIKNKERNDIVVKEGREYAVILVPERDLPVKLPEIKDYKPRGDGKSPLAKEDKWVKVKCPKCKGAAERETDTMDTFIDSSWYFLRYLDPKNKKEFASKVKMRKWMPVDRYSGGAEHTTMHLLYSRFWIKAMYDLGLVDWDEPFAVRMNRGLILGPDGQKMSKSRGNVVAPDEYVRLLGADTVRMYLAFIGPYNQVGAYPWNPKGITGIRRFLENVVDYLKTSAIEPGRLTEDPEAIWVNPILPLLNKTIKGVGEDIENFKFNTAISKLMIFLNSIRKESKFVGGTATKVGFIWIGKDNFEKFLKLLAPFAPHLAEELWREKKWLGHNKSIHREKWPKHDKKIIASEPLDIQVFDDVKIRDVVKVDLGLQEEFDQLLKNPTSPDLIVKYGKELIVIEIKNGRQPFSEIQKIRELRNYLVHLGTPKVLKSVKGKKIGVIRYKPGKLIKLM